MDDKSATAGGGSYSALLLGRTERMTAGEGRPESECCDFLRTLIKAAVKDLIAPVILCLAWRGSDLSGCWRRLFCLSDFASLVCFSFRSVLSRVILVWMRGTLTTNIQVEGRREGREGRGWGRGGGGSAVASWSSIH